MNTKRKLPTIFNIILLLCVLVLLAVLLLKSQQDSTMLQAQVKQLQTVIKSYNEQEKLNAAFDKLMSEKITRIRNIKYPWQLAPFVGKNVEILGISKDRKVKNADKFSVNGNDNIIIHGCDQEVGLARQGVTFRKKGKYVVSDYLLLRGRLCFNRLTEETIKKYREKDDSYYDVFPSPPRFYLTDIEVRKIYKTPLSSQNRPDSISLAIPSKESNIVFNTGFLGLVNSASLLPLLRFSTSFERTFLNKHHATQNYNLLNSVNSILDLIPFLGSYVEVKGKLAKSRSGNPFVASLVINEKNNLFLPIRMRITDSHRLGQPIVCRGNLLFSYGKYTTPSIGAIYLGNVECIDKINKQNSWTIKRLPDTYISSEWKKSFFTGFLGDANYLVFRSYITKLIKYYPKEHKLRPDSKY
jgi:hypothetical protein